MTDAALTSSPPAPRRSFDRRKLGRWALLTVSGLAFVYILTPLIFVTWLSFYAQEIPSFPPEGYSLHWYSEAIGNDRFIDAFILSAELGVVSTLIGLALAIPASLGLTRLKFRGRDGLGNLMLMPLIVPGIVLGIALYIFHVELEINTGLPIIGSFYGLVWGHVLLVIPWAVRLITASLSPQYLQYEGIRATQALAESDNAKVIVIGGENGLPVILGNQ